MLKNKTVLLGVTGGIACYKAAALASALVKQHCTVHVIMTKNATEFISPLTFEQLTGNIMNRIPEKEPAVPQTIHITTWQRIKPWFYMAAMFCIIMITARYMLIPSSNEQMASKNPTKPSSATEYSYTDEYIEETIMNMQADDYTVYCYLTDNDSESS